MINITVIIKVIKRWGRSRGRDNIRTFPTYKQKTTKNTSENSMKRETSNKKGLNYVLLIMYF